MRKDINLGIPNVTVILEVLEVQISTPLVQFQAVFDVYIFNVLIKNSRKAWG